MSRLESAATNSETAQQEDMSGPPSANRHRLPDERASLTHHFSIAGHEGYLTVGLYPNGQPGEIFVRMAKEGSTIAGLMECFGTVVSVSLQHGVPLKVLCDKLSHTRFEPSG
jgi:ribonucleoside-diphosphate reductase alpha chain